MEAAKLVLDAEEREGTAEWIEDLHNVADPYGLTMDTDLMRTAEFLRSTDVGKKGEENDHDRKPAAEVASLPAVNAGETTVDNGTSAVKVGEPVSSIVKENVVNDSVM